MSRQAIHRPLCPDGRAVAAEPCERPCPQSSRPFVLLATIVASAMAFIDGTIVTIALPAIQTDLDAGFGTLQWVVNGYALMLGGLILIGGAAGDRFGRRRLFLAGIVVFLAASILCALAPGGTALIVGRAVQGVGAALLVPQSLAIIAAAFPREVRGRAIGLWAGASAITTALGPPLGGVLIDWFDWRSIFWLNLPLAAVAIWATVVHVPESRDESASGDLDWKGAILAVAGFALLTVGLTLLAESPDSRGVSLSMLLAGVLTLLAFVRVESGAASPILPLALFDDRLFTGANLVTLFLYGALTGVLFLLPFELIERRGLSATEVGLTLVPLGLIIGTLSRYAGDWADRHGPRGPLVSGAFVVGIATLGLALNADAYVPGVLLPVVLLSIGMAAIVAPLTTAVMNAAPDERSGAASGVNNAASRVAGLFAVAILGALASAVFRTRTPAQDGTRRFGALPEPGDPLRAALEAAFVDAYSAAMMTVSAWAFVATALAYWITRPSRSSVAHS